MWLHELRLDRGRQGVLSRAPSSRLPKIQIAVLSRNAGLMVEREGLLAVLVLRGSVSIGATEASQTVGARRYLVVEPAEALRIQQSAQGLALVIGFTQAALRRLDALTAQKPLPGSGALDSALLQVLCRAIREAHEPGNAFCLREAAIRSLIRHLARLQMGLRDLLAACPGKSRWRRTQVLMRLQRARQFLDSNCDRTVSISELAASVNFSTWYFSKTFHRVYGESPKAYATRVRLERARSILHHDDVTINEVAAACGFGSHSAFSRAYRQCFGVTAWSSRAASGTAACAMPTHPVKHAGTNRRATA